MIRRLRQALLRRKAQLGFAWRAFRIARKRNAATPAPAPGPVVVAGFFSDSRGVARSARLTVDALRAEGLHVVEHDVSAIQRPGGRAPPPPAAGPLILHANPPEAARLLADWPASSWAARFHIGYWVWELPAPPPAWGLARGWFDEIWTPSRYSADALARLPGTTPIRVMRHPVPPIRTPPDRARFGLRDGVTYALCAYDLRSSRARKNPDAAIKAYLAALPAPREDVALVIKTLGPEADPEAMRDLESLQRTRSDVQLIADTLSDEAMLALIASADIVVSLHRAEGFGLILAEAMRLGKAVLATAWSGNLEFMTGESAALVPAKLISVRDPSGAYRASHWAEPNVAAAADMLRLLINDPARRAALGARAQIQIAEALDGAYARADWSAGFTRAVGGYQAIRRTFESPSSGEKRS